MKHYARLIPLLVLLFFFVNAKAQCPPEGYVFCNSQDQIDQFLMDYPYCTEIGSLTITGTEINNLFGFTNIEIIQNSLSIFNVTHLTNLDDLSDITTVGGNIEISSNSDLINIDGLSNINSIGYDLLVENNNNLSTCCVIEDLATLVTNQGNSVVVSNNADGCNSLSEIETECVLPQCPPSFIEFNSQAEIDQFVIDYPYCSNLTNGVFISGEDITNLSAFSNVTSVNGHFSIYCCNNLTDLTGLENLTTVSDNLVINTNEALTNIEAWGNVTTVGGYFIVINNDVLTNLNGLTNLNSVNHILIQFNDVLESLNGMSSLSTINSSVRISDNNMLADLGSFPYVGEIGTFFIAENNQSLTNLNGFASLLTIGGALRLVNNDALTDISALAYVYNFSYDLEVVENDNLSNCCILEFMASLVDGNYPVTIENNGENCNSLAEIVIECNDLPECPDGDIILSSQQDVDQLGMYYPNCTEIAGNISITGNDITNLDGLTNIQQVLGNISITNNPLLTNLDGLSNIQNFATNLTVTNNLNLADCCVLEDIAESVLANGNTLIINNNVENCNSLIEIDEDCALPQCPIGNLFLYTQADIDQFIIDYPNCTNFQNSIDISTSGLNNLNGLSNLIEIGGHLFIYSTDLVNLTGLDNLQIIGDYLQIENNDFLTDIESLGNITSLGGNLYVNNNPNLASCCPLINLADLAITAGNNYNIDDNDDDCSSLPVIEEYCNPGICPPGNVILESQADIEQFINVYPNCTQIAGYLIIDGGDSNDIVNINGLSNLILIEDNLTIEATQLTSLNALSNLLEVWGGLRIKNNTDLQNIDGLSNLIEIGEGPIFSFDNIEISNNNVLTNIDGLTNITNFVGNITIVDNPMLQHLNGFSNLTEISRLLGIYNNDALINLNGLSNLTTIGGHLEIRHNEFLGNLNGLSNLTSVGQYINIYANPNLQDVSGLENIINFSDNLNVYDNPNLSVCCNLVNLAQMAINTSNSVNIQNNSSVCSSLEEIEENCAPIICPIGDVVLTNQLQIDSFIIDYESCTEIAGNLTISGTDITNINGLSYLTGISGSLVISGNPNLLNLNGLANLNIVYGNLQIENNNALNDISGLLNLATVTDNVNIGSNNSLTNLNGLAGIININGSLTITNNNALVNLGGLFNLLSIQDDLVISNNAALPYLGGLNSIIYIGGDIQLNDNTGLINIDALSDIGSIAGNLQVQDNSNLSACCDLLTLAQIVTTAGNTVTIQNNAEGCNSLQEIEADPNCEAISVQSINQLNNINIYPNPATNWLNLNSDLGIEIIEIYDFNGRLLKSENNANQLDISDLTVGIYLAKITIEGQNKTLKFVRE